MKKIAIMFLTLATIGMANSSTSVVNKNVKMTQSEVSQNDREIKKITDEILKDFKAEMMSFTTAEIEKNFGEKAIQIQLKEMLRDTPFETKKEKDFYEKLIVEMMRALYKNLRDSNLKLRIYQGKTTYLSKNNAKVELMYEMLNVDSFDKNDVIFDRAFEKSGITDKEIETLNVGKAKLERLYKAFDEEIARELRNAKLDREVFATVELKKSNGNWEIVDVK